MQCPPARCLDFGRRDRHSSRSEDCCGSTVILDAKILSTHGRNKWARRSSGVSSCLPLAHTLVQMMPRSSIPRRLGRWNDEIDVHVLLHEEVVLQ